MQNNYSVYNECLVPVLQQSFESVWLLLFYCLVFRILCTIKIPKSLVHVISFVFGCLSLWKFYEEAMIYVIMPAIIIMMCCRIREIPGLFLTFLTGSYMLARFVKFVLLHYYLSLLLCFFVFLFISKLELFFYSSDW